MDRGADVVRTRGPVDLPEELQGRTLVESLRRAVSRMAFRGPYSTTLPRAVADGLEQLLDSAADTVSILEHQLQEQIDQRIELEEYERLMPPAPGWSTTDNLVIQVVYEEDDFDPFVQGLWGWAVAETVWEIDAQLREDPEQLFEKGRGVYRYEVHWVPPEDDNEGRTMNAGYFDLTEVQFTPSAREEEDSYGHGQS